MGNRISEDWLGSRGLNLKAYPHGMVETLLLGRKDGFLADERQADLLAALYLFQEFQKGL